MYRGGSRARGRGGLSRGGGNRPVSNQPKGLFVDGVWHCNCSPRLPAEHFKVKKEGKNQGRWFYVCQQGEEKRCNFFLWEDDAKPREEAAVLGGKRTEPTMQQGWSAGRPTEGHGEVQGKGMFAGKQRTVKDDEETDSASSTSSEDNNAVPTAGRTKRKANEAELDDNDFMLSSNEEEELAQATFPETPHKLQKTGIYATPATTGKRKLPWQELLPSSPADSAFASPSKASVPPETPAAISIPYASTPSPPSRHKDALYNPADQGSSLTAEVLSALSSVTIPQATFESLRSILSKHDLKTQGVTKGRDISRLALKAKDAEIAELKARIGRMEAELALQNEMRRVRRREGS